MKKMGKNNLETVKINSGVSQQKTRPLSMFLSQEKLVHSFCAYKYTLLIAITWNILIVNQYLGSALDHTTSAALLHTSCQVYTNYQTMKYLSSSNRQCVVHSLTLTAIICPTYMTSKKRAHTRQIPVFFMLQQLYYLVDSSSNSMCHSSKHRFTC